MESFYIGTNSIRGSQGIYHMKLEPSKGCLQICSSVQAYNAGGLFWNARDEVLYALSEGMTFMGKASGGILALATDQSPPVITGQAATSGQRPCSLSLSPDGTELAVGHFLGGRIAILGQGEDNAAFMCKHTIIPESPAAGVHHVVYSPQGGCLLSLEVKESAIHVYDRERGYAEVYRESMGEGVFPRQMAFSRDGTRLYVVSQRQSRVFVYRWQPQGQQKLYLIQTVGTVPPGYAGMNAPSAVRVSPDGTLLAVANRIFDHIALYQIGRDGALDEPVFCPLKGSLPRDIAFSADGGFLIAAETATDTVSSYRVNRDEPGLKWSHTCHVPAPAAVAVGKEAD